MPPLAVGAGNSCHPPSEPLARRYTFCRVITTSSVYCSVLSVVRPVKGALRLILPVMSCSRVVPDCVTALIAAE